MKSLPKADLDLVAKYFQENKINLEKASFLISGVTGFVGSWLLDSLMHINKEFGLKIEITGITRNASKVDGWVDLASAKMSTSLSQIYARRQKLQVALPMLFMPQLQQLPRLELVT